MVKARDYKFANVNAFVRAVLQVTISFVPDFISSFRQGECDLGQRIHVTAYLYTVIAKSDQAVD